MPESTITKRALSEALKALMRERPLAQITVGDICQNCGMSRKSFYYHFKDKYDLVNWTFYTEFVQRIRGNSYENAWALLGEICAYLYENRRFYVNAFRVEGQNSLTEHFTEIFRPLTLEYLRKSLEGKENCEFYAGFYTDAFRAAIVKWLREEAEIKPDEFVRLLKGAMRDAAWLADTQLTDPLI